MTEPRYTEAQIREVFFEHGFSPGSTHGPYAYLDTVLATLRAAVESPAQPPTTHEFRPLMSTIPMGAGSDPKAALCADCGLSFTRHPLHHVQRSRWEPQCGPPQDDSGAVKVRLGLADLQRGADTPQPEPTLAQEIYGSDTFRRLMNQPPFAGENWHREGREGTADEAAPPDAMWIEHRVDDGPVEITDLGADTPQPETAEITNRWLENHLYVDPSYVGAWCEHITHVTLDGYGSARCNKRPSEHVSAVPYTTEIAQSAVRGADVPTTEPPSSAILSPHLVHSGEPTTPEDRHEFKPYRKRCVHGLDVGQECGLKADDPIHQATPEERHA